MNTSLSFILVNYYTNIAPLAMGDYSGQSGQTAPLDFGAKQRNTFVEPILYKPNATLSFNLSKVDIPVDASLDVILTDYTRRTFNSSLDTILIVPHTDLDVILTKEISTNIGIDCWLAVEQSGTFSVDSIFGKKSYRKVNVDALLQETKDISLVLDSILKLSAVFANIDCITTPEISGERDIYEFAANVHTEETAASIMTRQIAYNRSIQNKLESDSNIQTTMEYGVDI